jgi:3'-phosphoadenosine 5'-phosphosulfate sulfotransferase (PAPS reductase)/FAD synthetase
MNARAKEIFGDSIDMMERAIEVQLGYIEKKHSLWFAVSGGKDSTDTMLLGLEAIRRAKQQGISQAHHHVVSADTLIENPTMQRHRDLLLDEVKEYCEKNDLPVSVHIVEPSLASQFVVSTLGRGTLIRTPSNSTKDGEKKRACSDDWKVKPQQRLQRELMADAVSNGFGEPISTLGTRFDESTSRGASMEARGESATILVRNKDKVLTLSPIADWTADDVWMMLGMFRSTDYMPWESSPVSRRSIDRLFELYSSGNEGQCGAQLGDSGNKASCGSRFGCSLCGIAGEQDKSMESQLKDEKYQFMAGLNKLRNYMLRTEWDMSLREMIGRTPSEAGYIQIKPDVYSFDHRMNLLRYMLTLDVLEVERAAKHEDDLVNRRIPDTEENREMCDVQFQLISPRQLVAIDFQLSMHYAAPHAFPALSAWYEVRDLGRRYHVPEITKRAEKVTVHREGWYPVGENYDLNVPTVGLRDFESEQWNKYRHPDRVFHYARTTQGDQVTYFEEKDTFDVDPQDALMFVECTFKGAMYNEAQFHSGLDSARFWLNEGLVKLPEGHAHKYQTIAKRNEYFRNLFIQTNMTQQEFEASLIKNSITDKEHQAIIDSEIANRQGTLDMFDTKPRASSSLRRP